MGFQKWIITLLIICILLLGADIFFRQLEVKPEGNLTQSQDNGNTLSVSRSTPTVDWERLESRGQALPVVQDQKLFVYSFTENRLVPTHYHTAYSGSAQYAGSRDPQVSPDAHYTLFLNRDDHDALYLLSSETLEVRKITQGPVEYITDWASDSKRFIYNIKGDSLSSRKVREGMSEEILPWDTKEKFFPDESPGFHVFDIQTGVDRHLFQIEGVAGFVDASHVLAVASEHAKNEVGKRERIVVFNIDSFEADYTTFVKPIEFGEGEYSFTHDGRHWAFNYPLPDGLNPNSPTSDMRIVYAKFPSLIGTVVEESTWADIQQPQISPEGRYVAYAKGTLFPKTRIWDVQNKKLIKELGGRPLQWLDEDRFVTQDPTMTNSSGPVAFVVYIVTRDTSETIPLDPRAIK